MVKEVLLLLWDGLVGYPVGAKIASNFRNNNILSKEECERLLSFTNNSGPLFIIGTVGISMFGNSSVGFLLLLTHILGAITVGFLFKFWKCNYHTLNLNKSLSKKDHDLLTENISFSNLGSILGESIYNSISTILMIGGFVVLFSVIISIINQSNILNMFSYVFLPICNLLNIPTSFITSIITGMIEITNGISLISLIKIKNISINIILSAFLLGIGGLSILFQVLSITSKTDLSIKPYIIGKLLHGCFSSLYTYIFIMLFPIFNLNL